MEPESSFSEQLRTVFETMDHEKRGSVRVERFADLAREHFGTESAEEVNALISLLDPSHTGRISFSSFCQGINMAMGGTLTSKGLSKHLITQVIEEEAPVSLSEVNTKFKLTDDDTHSNDGASESTYNEYDDSALTDMSEDNVSPLFYDGQSPAVDGDDADSAIAGTTGINGFFGDHIKSHNGQHGSSTTASSLVSEGEERFEDFGENSEAAGSGVEIEVQHIPASLSGSSETLLDTHTVNNNPVRRITSKEFANQLYRSSSSNSLPRGTAMDDAYGEYAASDSDVVELNDKVKELEDQVTVLEQDNASRLDTQSKLRHDNALLHQQINSLEEQLREAELRHQDVTNKESRRHRELLIRQERDYQDQIEALTSKLAVLEREKESNDVDVPRLKSQLEHFKKEKTRLESDLQDIDQKWLALSMEYQRKQEQFSVERQELEEMLKANEALIDELSKEVTDLRRCQAEQDQRFNLMRSPSISDLPSRFDEVKQEVHKLKRENAHLKENNDELSAQVLNNGVQIGRSLLHRGSSKSESFAAELETSSKDDIMQALKEEEQMNRDLREYIGQILTRILESNPNLLEIKPRQRHGSTASAASTSSSLT